MPELPEVETVRRQLDERLRGRRVEALRIRDSRLRFGLDETALSRHVRGKTAFSVRRRAKYLLVEFSGGGVLLAHLGMTGRFTLQRRSTPLGKHDHVVFELDDGDDLRFNDPRRFGVLDAFPRDREPSHKLLAHLGVEPLGPEFSAELMRGMARTSKRPIKNFLMDATKVVGVGNIYASESLHLAGIHPKRLAGRLSGESWRRLIDRIRFVLEDAIENGGTTLRDFMSLEGRAGDYSGSLRVYGKAGARCGVCDAGTIRRIVMTGRSTFYCPKCQR